eukprot:4252530-Alexandrium_andersonii.AAC.1
MVQQHRNRYEQRLAMVQLLQPDTCNDWRWCNAKNKKPQIANISLERRTRPQRRRGVAIKGMITSRLTGRGHCGGMRG